MNRNLFLARLGPPLFDRPLTRRQRRGVHGLLDAFVQHGDGRADTLAYGLATVYHETGKLMVPVREGFARSDASARAKVRRLAARRGPGSGPARYGQPAGPHGHVYYGRGHVQLTWAANYDRCSVDAGVDLLADPDAMLDAEISARLLWRGLLDGRWNPEGHGLRQYLDQGDVVGARYCVNLTDRAEDLARYHAVFLAAVEAAGGVPVTLSPTGRRRAAG
jgi:predicted chitinase